MQITAVAIRTQGQGQKIDRAKADDYRPPTMNTAITIVSGLPRSGTSMMMKMLEAGGMEVVTDNIREADVDNPEGYYEFEKVKQLEEDASWIPDLEGKAVKMVSALLRHLPPEHDYHVIVMNRDFGEMLASQTKMLRRLGADSGGLSDEKMADLFRKQVAGVNQWLAQQPNIQVLDLRYGDIVKDPLTHAQRVTDFLATTLDINAMACVVNPDLHRNRAT